MRYTNSFLATFIQIKRQLKDNKVLVLLTMSIFKAIQNYQFMLYF